MKYNFTRTAHLICIFTAVILYIMPAQTPANTRGTTPAPSEERHTWNLKNVDIHSIINELSAETGRNFVLSPDVKGKVSLISATPLSADELYQAFIALLSTNGFAAVPDGPVVKIIPQLYSREASSPVYNPDHPSLNEELAVSIVRVRYASAADLVRILKQLVFHFGYMEAYSPTNDIIISDFSGNITRLQTLIKTLDRPSATHVSVIHLKFTQAADLVKTLSELIRQRGGDFENMTFAADRRSNDILTYGGTPELQLQLKALVAELDAPMNQTRINTEVVSLKYLRAEKMAVILNSLIENYKQSKTGQNSPSLPGSSGLPEKTDLSHSAQLPDYATSSTTSGNAIQNNGNSMASNTRTMVDFTNMAKKELKSGSISPFVQWEESTNSVILTAPDNLMKKLKAVIKKLDTRRPQVLIEAVIAEVEVDRANELGIELNTGGRVQLLTRFTSTLPLSGIGNDNSVAISNPPTPDATGQGLTGAWYRGQNLRLLIRALEQDSRSNILSTPNIVTLDNEPAQIKVGQRVSFSIGQIQNNPTGGNPFNYFNQQDVGLILTINPQITSDGSIKLIIEQELSNILPGQVSAGNNPNLSERFIHTTVMANNGDLLVLGGLIQNEWQDVTSKVPFLGNIPAIGLLFRSHEKQLKRQNLMIFLRPTILFDDPVTPRLISDKYQDIRQQQLATREKMPDGENTVTPPVLPDIPPVDARLPGPFDL